MLTMRPNGKPGELLAITNWLGKIVLGVLITLLSSATIEGFMIWRNQAIQTYEVIRLRESLEEHMRIQRQEESGRLKRDIDMATDVATAKQVVDESFRQLDHRITRIEQVCCGGSK